MFVDRYNNKRKEEAHAEDVAKKFIQQEKENKNQKRYIQNVLFLYNLSE